MSREVTRRDVVDGWKSVMREADRGGGPCPTNGVEGSKAYQDAEVHAERVESAAGWWQRVGAQRQGFWENARENPERGIEAER